MVHRPQRLLRRKAPAAQGGDTIGQGGGALTVALVETSCHDALRSSCLRAERRSLT